MSSCPFCNFDEAPQESPIPSPASEKANKNAGFLRHAWRGVQWLFPAMMWMLIPKCPMCVAAYVALFTGIEISFAAARWIHFAMWALCLLSLAYLAFKIVISIRRKIYVYRTSHARRV
jgi:hypothetical protein